MTLNKLLKIFFFFLIFQTMAFSNITVSTGGTTCSESIGTYSGTSCTVNVSDIATSLDSGDVSIETTGNITLDGDISYTTNTERTLTFKAAGYITVNAAKTISSTANKLNTIFWADSDGNSAGHIWFKASSSTAGATVRTNGGNLYVSGGSDYTTDYAFATSTMSNGVLIDRVTFETDGGDIIIRGKSTRSSGVSASTSGGTYTNTNGVRFAGSIVMDSGTGKISVNGYAGGGGASNGIETNQNGYSKFVSSATSGRAIEFYGNANIGGNGSNGWGVFLWGGNSFGIVVAATGGGEVHFEGYGRDSVSGAAGVHLEPNAFLLSSSGKITLDGTKGSSSSYEDIGINSTVGYVDAIPAGFGFSSPVTSSSSDIDIIANNIKSGQVFGGGTVTSSAIQSTGTLTISPKTSGKNLYVQSTNPGSSNAWINSGSMFGLDGLFKTGFTKLVFGSGTTGDVKLDSFTFDQDTEITTANNVILGAITITSKTLTVNATGGSSTITDSGAVKVANLSLSGTNAAVTLDGTTNLIDKITINTDTLALSNNAAKNSSAFVRWNTASDGSGTDYSGSYTSNSSLTLYSLWGTNSYIVQYSPNSATSGSAPSSQTKTQDVDLTLATNSGNLAKTDFYFAGWNTQSDGGGTDYAVGATFSSNTNITLYAKWSSSQTYTVSFNSNSGSAVSSQFVANGDTATEPTAPTRSGYTFGGWYSDSGLTTSFAFTTAITGNTTLYAKWTAVPTYTVTYNANGATSGSAPSNQTKTQGVDLILATNSGTLAKTDYTFGGWNTQADGSGINYTAGGTYSTDADLTLYAKWSSTATHEVTVNGVTTEAESNLAGTSTQTNGNGEVVTTGSTTNSDNKTVGVEVKAETTGEAVHKLEIQSDSVTAEAISKIIGAKTIINSDGSLETNATKNGVTLSVKANNDGTAEHRVIVNGKTSVAKSQIQGESNTTIETDGSVKTIAKSKTVTLNGYTVKVEILTDVDGKTVSKYLLVDNATNQSINTQPTVDTDTPLEEGNIVNVREDGSEMYIDANTILTNKIKF
jgi:uncharacterized repeat protein (TIGR02543 family)